MKSRSIIKLFSLLQSGAERKNASERGTKARGMKDESGGKSTVFPNRFRGTHAINEKCELWQGKCFSLLEFWDCWMSAVCFLNCWFECFTVWSEGFNWKNYDNFISYIKTYELAIQFLFNTIKSPLFRYMNEISVNHFSKQFIEKIVCNKIAN